MSELGNFLKSTRIEQKKSVQDVVDDTRIRENFIKIIEEGNFQELPSYIHAYGFVKKYAEFLNLDYENVVWPLFAKECPKSNAPVQQEEIDNEEYTPSTTETSFLENGKKDGKKTIKLVILVIVLSLIGYGGYYVYSNNALSNSNVGSNASSPVPAAVVETDTVVTFTNDNASDSYASDQDDTNSIFADNATDDVSYDNTTKTEQHLDPLFAQTIPTPVVLSPEKVTVRFSENCWFKYSTDKGEGNEVNAKRGTKIDIEFDKTFNVEIGNAVAVSMEYNGSEYSNFGGRNVVRILNYKAQDGKLELIKNR